MGNRKKSLVIAFEKAQKLSLKNPGVPFYVLDKKHHAAIVTASEEIRQERFLEGWNVDCRLLNGKQA